MVAIATNQSRFRSTGSLPVGTIKDAWTDACKGMEFAINFLKNNAGIESPALLSSLFLLIPIGYFAHKRSYSLSEQESRQLKQWVLLANVKGHYSRGSSETILDQDLAVIRDGGDVSILIDRLRQQVGRLEIAPEELEGRNQRSALLKTMFLAFRAAGATDWKTQLQIALDHSGVQHRLQFHHIFPKAVLKGTYSSREADDIANLCFISGKTNRQISAKEPQVYFPDVMESAGTAAFDKQCIPHQPSLLGIEQYKDFLLKRRQLIADRLNAFLFA